MSSPAPEQSSVRGADPGATHHYNRYDPFDGKKFNRVKF